MMTPRSRRLQPHHGSLKSSTSTPSWLLKVVNFNLKNIRFIEPDWWYLSSWICWKLASFCFFEMRVCSFRGLPKVQPLVLVDLPVKKHMNRKLAVIFSLEKFHIPGISKKKRARGSVRLKVILANPDLKILAAGFALKAYLSYPSSGFPGIFHNRYGTCKEFKWARGVWIFRNF